MENTLVRNEQILGSSKNIVGNTRADLILESLGKIYLKTGQKTRLLNDVFNLIDKIDTSNISSKVMTTDSLDLMKYPGEGYLIFDVNKSALYISYDQRYLLLVDDVDDFKTVNDLYVKKEGDVMTGPLTIKHKGAPLIVASSNLVRNLNAQYLNGCSDEQFAKKEIEEHILGKWSFENKTTFEKESTFNDVIQANNNINANGNIKANKDIILTTNSKIGSQIFESGYNGIGWQLDSSTNMLTVDYLTVRKAMMVYELIINKIQATNGSLWVTDSGKIKVVYRDGAGDDSKDNVWKSETREDYFVSIDGNVHNSIPTRYYFVFYEYSSTNSQINIVSTSKAEIIEPGFVVRNSEGLQFINIYNTYFKDGDLYIISLDDEYPIFDKGDLIRCQKFENNNIRYYDGLVIAKLSYNTYAVKIATSVFDKGTHIEYDEKGNVIMSEEINPVYYNVNGEETRDDIVSVPQVDDSLVRIGNIFNVNRQNSVFITSSDNNSPYIQTMSDINRPDYNVYYDEVLFKKEDGKYIGISGTYDYITSSNMNDLEQIIGTNNHVKVRLGNLNGLYEPIFGEKQPHGYGLFADNVFLKGEFMLNNGSSVVNFAKDEISMSLEDVGIYLSKEGNPEYNNANIVLTGKNTYIDSDLIIDSNSMDITDENDNNLKINAQNQQDGLYDMPINQTSISWDVNSSQFGKYQQNDNTSGELDYVHVSNINSATNPWSSFSTIPGIFIASDDIAKNEQNQEFAINSTNLNLILGSNGGFMSSSATGYNFYLDTGYATPSLTPAYYIYNEDTGNYSKANESDLLGNQLYAYYTSPNGISSYEPANTFVYGFIMYSNGEHSYCRTQDGITVTTTASGIDYTLKSNIKGAFVSNIGNHSSKYGIPSQIRIDGVWKQLSQFTLTKSKGVEILKLTVFSEQNITLENLKVKLNGNNKEAKHTILNTLPESITGIDEDQFKESTEKISKDTEETVYYAILLKDIDFNEYYNLTFEVDLTKTLIENKSKSHITPSGFLFNSPNRKNFIEFSNNGFKVGSTTNYVIIDGAGIQSVKVKASTIRENNIQNLKLEEEKTTIHSFT